MDIAMSLFCSFINFYRNILVINPRLTVDIHHPCGWTILRGSSLCYQCK